MDSGSPDCKVLTAPQMYNMDILNGSHLTGQPAFPGQAYNGAGNKITLEQVDPSTFDDDDSEDDYGSGKGNKPGKKTKGRVKIKMEFIENKLRRYTTFSKRKTGIMKKAYELSTLTGTQVMLLVASETGHVYTFATRKLQPMITSESGKALIQTCLNSPDPPPIAPGQQQAVEQRMNPGGFEETELTYAVEEENGKSVLLEPSSGVKPVYTMSSTPSSGEVQYVQQPQSAQHLVQQPAPSQPQQQVTMATVVQQQPSQQLVSSGGQTVSTAKSPATQSIAVQLPGLPPGFILQPGTAFTMPVQTQPSGGNSPQSQTQQVYRLPTQQIITSGTVVQQTDTGQQQQQENNNDNNNTTGASPALGPSVFMYQTPQGIVYAPATGSLQDKTILNFQQPGTHTMNVSQQDTQGVVGSQTQQIITIPVPVSLAQSTQVLQLSAADMSTMQQTTGTRLDVTAPTGAKKRKL